jgi:ubiquinone/menaquinone biosynthesis C-methylase UbiE
MQRTLTPELLDSDLLDSELLEPELLSPESGSAQEVANALRSLRWVNQLFGGSRMHTALLTHVARTVSRPDFHILEVAAGHASALQAAALKLLPIKPQLRITLLDKSAQAFPSRNRWLSHLPVPDTLVADALRVPLPDSSVDVVSSSLFLHQLNLREAAYFLKESLRVARVAVVINDLERSMTHFALARLLALVDPSRLSRRGGPASVRQAYTLPELKILLQTTGHSYEVRQGYLFRLGAILWK